MSDVQSTIQSHSLLLIYQEQTAFQSKKLIFRIINVWTIDISRGIFSPEIMQDQ